MVKDVAPRFLVGRRLVCTGASSGIGRRFAIAAAEYGASVILVGRDQNRLSETMKSMPEGDHEMFALDMTNSDTVSDWLQSAVKENPAIAIKNRYVPMCTNSAA